MPLNESMNPDTRNRADRYWWRRYLAEINAQTMMREVVTTDRVNALANQISTFAKLRGEEIAMVDAVAEAWDRLYVDNFEEWVGLADKFVDIILATIVDRVVLGDPVNIRGWYGFSLGPRPGTRYRGRIDAASVGGRVLAYPGGW